MRKVILNFHGLGEPGRRLEPGEAPYWIGPAFFADILDLAGALADRVAASVTFDDGNLSDATIAAPELVRRGLRAKFFVLAGRLGHDGSLGAGHLRDLVGGGHEIGNHGWSHRVWTRLDDTGIREEMDLARSIIAEAAGRPVTEAAIPLGRYDRRVLEALRRAGYERCYSSDGGGHSSGRFLLPRTSIRSDMRIDDVRSILLGQESPLRWLRRTVSMQIRRRV